MEENLQPLQAKKQILIFGGSILRGIKLREFNYWLHKDYAQLKSQLYCMLVLMPTK